MKFYCIVENDSEDSKNRYSPIKKACDERDIEFVKLIPEEYDYTTSDIEQGSLIYRATPGPASKILEKHIMNDSFSSFYLNTFYCFREPAGSIYYNQKSGLPVIKTVPDFISNKNLLEKYVEYVGGFPVIVKVLNGSHGVGVMKVDSIEALKSLTDLLQAKNIQPVVLRQFIKHKKQGRLIVLGNKVIASHANHAALDFRSNVGDNLERVREVMTFSKEIQKIAVEAVKSVGIEFGGVDILFDEETDEPFIAEVNYPCFFPTTQNLTGVDIAGAMVDYLLEKAMDMVAEKTPQREYVMSPAEDTSGSFLPILEPSEVTI